MRPAIDLCVYGFLYVVDYSPFSERYGHKPRKEIQLENVNSDLRNRIWNRVYDLLPTSKIGGFERLS